MRPREKLQQHGFAVLSDDELLALLLRSGSGKLGVGELSGRLLSHYGGLGGLLNASLPSTRSASLCCPPVVSREP